MTIGDAGSLGGVLTIAATFSRPIYLIPSWAVIMSLLYVLLTMELQCMLTVQA